jgi:uncharacterized protein (TIGR00730 family)
MAKDCVAVFGSSQATPETPHYRLAGELGRELALRGAVVRCGGYGGVMEAVANGVKSGGGRIVGCTLEWFRATRIPFRGLDEIEESVDLHDRIECLLRGARGAVVLPGGVGTLNELFWVWTLLLHDRDEGPESLVLLGEPWPELLSFLARRFEFGDPILALVRVALTAGEAADIAWGATPQGS